MAIKEKDEAVEEDEEELEDELEPAPGASEMRAALDVLHRGLQEADLPVFDEFWRMEKIIKEQLAEKFPPSKSRCTCSSESLESVPEYRLFA